MRARTTTSPPSATAASALWTTPADGRTECHRGRGVSCRQGGRPAWPTPGTGTGSSVAFRRAKCRRRAGVPIGAWGVSWLCWSW
ncbi:unnamed protein product [Effrenium voratum]|nr:unnamed protein product [Effrenium voratum]